MIGSGVGDSSMILTSRSSGAHLIVAHIESAVNPAAPERSEHDNPSQLTN
jgi:hypothetical protein